MKKAKVVIITQKRVLQLSVIHEYSSNFSFVNKDFLL